MKTRLFTLATAVVVCFFTACGSGNGTATGSDSVKMDTTMSPAASDTSVRTDTSMHGTDTTNMPK